MKNRLIKYFSFLFVLVILFGIFSVAITGASANKPDVDISQASAVSLYNINTDKVIYSVESDKKIFPGSTVKMMTGLIACEILSDRLDEVIHISDKMLEGTEGANVKLRSGMSLTVENLLYGLLCGGGNDACLVIANICYGSSESFVQAMNDKAHALGMKRTFFTNPTGLDDENMYSTVGDIVLLAKAASQNNLYLDISSSVNYEFTPIGESESIKIYNRNSLISNFYAFGYTNPNTEGLIAGNTDLGGYCVVTFAEKQGTQYICAVMGAQRDEDKIYSYEIANSLISYAFDNLIYTKIASAGEYICDAPVNYVTPEANTSAAAVPCVIKSDVYALADAEFSDDKNLQYKYYLHRDTLNAPVKEGTIVGGVDILYNGEYVGSAMLVTASSVKANGVLLFLKNLREFFTSLPFWLSILAFIIMLSVYLYLSDVSNRRRLKIGKFRRKF